MSGPAEHPVAFYCVSSAAYFLGAVALVNSLRLHGHREPIHVLDAGLEPAQRELLEPEATIVPGPRDASPYLLKTVAPLRHPADVMVLIDADMIATRSLRGLVARSASGGVVAFRTRRTRHFPEWEELLDLGPIPRRPSVSSGLVLLGGSTGREVLELLDDRQRRVESARGYGGANALDYPLLMLDQDVLNAILASRVEPGRIVALDHRLAPDQPFEGLRIDDEARLRCSYEDRVEPYVLHCVGHRKPWRERLPEDAYSRLLARLLRGDDVAIAVPDAELPVRMRGGLGGRLARGAGSIRDRAGWLVRDRLPERAVARLDTRRRRQEARR